MKPVFPALLVAVMCLAGCGPEVSATEAGKPEAPKSDAPKTIETAAEQPKADAAGPFSKVIATDDAEGKETKATLSPTAAKFIVKFTLAAKKGDKFTAALFLDKTDDPKLEGKVKEETKEMPEDGVGDGDFGFLKPDTDWPKGEYHFELSLNGELKEKSSFKVE